VTKKADNEKEVNFSKLLNRVVDIKHTAKIGAEVMVKSKRSKGGREEEITLKGTIDQMYANFVNIKIGNWVNSYVYSDIIKVCK